MSRPVRYHVDANILLRFLTGEPVAQATGVRKLFSQAARGEAVLQVSAVILAEVFYTLLSYNQTERKTAAEQLGLLLKQPGVQVEEPDRVFPTLEYLRQINVGFADAYLAAGAGNDHASVASFDRDFNKFKDVIRYEPVA